MNNSQIYISKNNRRGHKENILNGNENARKIRVSLTPKNPTHPNVLPYLTVVRNLNNDIDKYIIKAVHYIKLASLLCKHPSFTSYIP